MRIKEEKKPTLVIKYGQYQENGEKEKKEIQFEEFLSFFSFSNLGKNIFAYGTVCFLCRDFNYVSRPFFIMIMCTTVNANDVSTTDAITNITDNNIKDNTSLTNTAGVEVQANVQTTTSHDNITNNEINTKLETNNEKQDVQTNAQKDLIVKHNSSTVKTDTEQIQKLTGLNITGIITTAYDKTNKIYAPDEDEGFVAAGAKITLYDESTGKRIGTTLSDINGYYQFLNLSEGYYSMELEYGTYAKGEEAIHLLDSLEFNYIFVPDLVIITFSGDSSGSGQSEKINYLSLMSDRFLFLESYELNSSYDRSGQWMVEGANFILVDMYSVGNGFGINDDIIAKSTASRNNHIAYVFGLFDESLLKGPLGNWGFLQNNPHDVQNTIVGSYWQTLSISDSPIIKRNMENLFSYIKYILGETKVDPTTVEGGQPLLLSNSWGLYYPGYENDVKTPSPDTIMGWMSNENPDNVAFAKEYFGVWDNIGFIKGLMATASDTAIITMQDILGIGSVGRMNTPGREGGNWQWRLESNGVFYDGTAERLNRITKLYGR